MIVEKDSIIKGAASTARRLRYYLSERRLRPGDRLPTHGALSRELGIGLLPLREGLGILEQHGFLETRRRGGTVVRKPAVECLTDPIRWHLEESGYTFDDMVEARAVLEGSVAAQAARVRAAKDLLVVLETLERLEAAKPGSPDHEQADEDFHWAVLQATHNPVMLIFGRLIVAQFRQKVREHLTASPRRLAEIVAEHRAIYTALEKRNERTAQRLMQAHIRKQIKEKTTKS